MLCCKGVSGKDIALAVQGGLWWKPVLLGHTEAVASMQQEKDRGMARGKDQERSSEHDAMGGAIMPAAWTKGISGQPSTCNPALLVQGNSALWDC